MKVISESQIGYLKNAVCALATPVGRRRARALAEGGGAAEGGTEFH